MDENGNMQNPNIDDNNKNNNVQKSNCNIFSQDSLGNQQISQNKNRNRNISFRKSISQLDQLGLNKNNQKKVSKLQELKNALNQQNECPLKKKKEMLRNKVKMSLFGGNKNLGEKKQIFTRFEVSDSKLEKELEKRRMEENKGIFRINNNFQDFYEEQEILGEGCVGLVKKARKIKTGELFACKQVSTRDEETIQNMLSEFEHLKELDHQNIVKVYEVYIDSYTGKVYLIMELIKGREMFEVINNLGSYHEEIAKKIFKQILDAINYMHEHFVCHRDLKPNNILCTEDGQEVKITDFNVSKFSEGYKDYSEIKAGEKKIKMWTYTGTVAFSAPELLSDGCYDESIDMWSSGVILYTMLSGYEPFRAEYLDDLIKLIISGEYTFPEKEWSKISKEAKDLISKCLTKDASQRINPQEALSHQWFTVQKSSPAKKLIERSKENMHRLIKNLKVEFLEDMPSPVKKFKQRKKAALIEGLFSNNCFEIQGVEDQKNNSQIKGRNLNKILKNEGQNQNQGSQLINKNKQSSTIWQQYSKLISIQGQKLRKFSENNYNPQQKFIDKREENYRADEQEDDEAEDFDEEEEEDEDEDYIELDLQKQTSDLFHSNNNQDNILNINNKQIKNDSNYLEQTKNINQLFNYQEDNQYNNTNLSSRKQLFKQFDKTQEQLQFENYQMGNEDQQQNQDEENIVYQRSTKENINLIKKDYDQKQDQDQIYLGVSDHNLKQQKNDQNKSILFCHKQNNNDSRFLSQNFQEKPNNTVSIVENQQQLLNKQKQDYFLQNQKLNCIDEESTSQKENYCNKIQASNENEQSNNICNNNNLMTKQCIKYNIQTQRKSLINLQPVKSSPIIKNDEFLQNNHNNINQQCYSNNQDNQKRDNLNICYSYTNEQNNGDINEIQRSFDNMGIFNNQNSYRQKKGSDSGYESSESEQYKSEDDIGFSGNFTKLQVLNQNNNMQDSEL